MSLLLRAALLGGIAYLITRSLSNQSAHRHSMTASEDTSSLDELHPGENHIWPTSDAQQRAAAAAGPSS